ncbi:DNA polymerase-3 subunit epsilon [Paracoccus aminovorans]|uniref:DNA-directed DNA polymerase n=1 Tax=Paracoccus aminovorans TaxID=34004 RepID=A0A1I3A7B9_9RHOB|nr:exonuclease domain-containing protein [Paracoccus aminovorans]SFH45918.1 DNA polymerase-3 subunit epsilon [Paracoccus aminovorans]
MKPDRGLLLAAALPGLALAAWAGLGLLLWRAGLPPEARAGLMQALAQGGALLAGWLALGAAAAAWLAARLHARLVRAPRRIADAVRNLAGNPAAPLLDDPGPLAQAVNRLAGQGRELRADMERLVAEASRKVAQERDQLGALMAELQQSVVVCNLDGRILLYNERARALFQRLSDAPQIAGGADLVGLGRSIHAVIDRALIDHARETVERHIARGEAAVSARFVTATGAGNLLQVVLAPVRNDAALTGYVLLLDDITREQAARSRRDQRLTGLTEASRASLANMQTALDMLDYPDLEPAERDSFHQIVRDEVQAMSARLEALTADAAQDMRARWPLQDMLGADLLAAAAGHIRAHSQASVAVEDPPGELWLSVDSFALVRALGEMAAERGPAALTLRLAPAATPGWAHLDLAWPMGAAPAEGQAGTSARAVAERHGGELWLEHDRARGLSFYRFLLPLASGEREAAGDPRPEFYDFDLFAAGAASHALDDSPLETLAYTVFDTETTGLDPAGGDEIIQIGAVRVLNGKILRGEGFDQLVDPGRSIPEASIPYHGIRPEMVRGQPRIAQVLPAFHAYAADTVLVGHNVAFDMRFLQLKEQATGLRFDQPVLDTLLLASIAQPHEPSQSLEAIAARLGVEIAARHNAAGDALATAQVFLALLPLLRQRGIATLGEARAAAEQSYYARLRY